MGPELGLEVADLLDALLHLSESALELNDVRKFRVDIFVVKVILVNKVFNDPLVPNDGKLLLQ